MMEVAQETKYHFVNEMGWDVFEAISTACRPEELEEQLEAALAAKWN